jgi:hypothetical protein
MKNLIFICLILVSFKACGQVSIIKSSKGGYIDMPKDSVYYTKDSKVFDVYHTKEGDKTLFIMTTKKGETKYFYISRNTEGKWGRKYRKVI